MKTSPGEIQHTATLYWSESSHLSCLTTFVCVDVHVIFVTVKASLGISRNASGSKQYDNELHCHYSTVHIPTIFHWIHQHKMSLTGYAINS